MEEVKSTTSEEKSDAFALTGLIFEQMAVFVLIHPPAISIQTEEDLSLRAATLLLMFIALCIGLRVIDWAGYSSFSQQKNYRGHTKSLWVCQEKLFWSCTIDQVWCRCWSGIPKCSLLLTGNKSKILIQQVFLEHCIWFLAHQRWLIS